MRILYSFFIGAGVAAFAYNTLARRVGYGNSQNVFVLIASIFIIATAFGYTIFAFILHI